MTDTLTNATAAAYVKTLLQTWGHQWANVTSTKPASQDGTDFIDVAVDTVNGPDIFTVWIEDGNIYGEH